MPDSERKPLPPYVPYRTFSNLLENLGNVGVPSHIDKNVIGSLSGGMQSWLKAALRYLKLIDSENVSSNTLRKLVAARDEDRKLALKQLFFQAYSFLDGRVDLSNTTQSQIKAAFADLGAQGETVEKMTAFLVAMGKDAGITLSPYLTKRAPATRKPRGPKAGPKPQGQTASPVAMERDGPLQEPHISPEQVLLGLLNPQQMSEEEMKAVWTLLVYLKK